MFSAKHNLNSLAILIVFSDKHIKIQNELK